MEEPVKKFELDLTWSVVASVEVEAETEQDARIFALNSMRRPDGDYVPYSREIKSVEPIVTNR